MSNLNVLGSVSGRCICLLPIFTLNLLTTTNNIRPPAICLTLCLAVKGTFDDLNEDRHDESMTAISLLSRFLRKYVFSVEALLLLGLVFFLYHSVYHSKPLWRYIFPSKEKKISDVKNKVLLLLPDNDHHQQVDYPAIKFLVS